MFFRFVRTVPRVLCFLSRNYSSALQTNQKESLNQALRSLIEDKSKAVWLLKITKCNAEDSFSFSKAYCKVQSVVADTANPEAFPFASLYLKGVNVLEDYLNGNLNRLNNLTPPERTCLEKLITFLENKKETTEKILKKSSLYSRHEVQWTAALAVYLLQELAVSSEFILDKFYPKREKLDPKLEYLVGDRFGDTSIGNPEVWHGCADILIGRRHHVQVDVECESHDLEDENSEDENYEEESSLGHQKILSEAIVFGCLQKELYPELNTFAPTVQISRENVVFYFYDSENDILIESSVFELFEMIMDDENDQLTFETILALWLTLNYRYLSSGVTHSMLERIDYRARFWEQLPSDKRKIYSKNLRIRNTREGKRSTSQVRISAGRRLFWSPARDVRGH